jgi:pimeloyl-ACP methyl ester carboxylesterase
VSRLLIVFAGLALVGVAAACGGSSTTDRLDALGAKPCPESQFSCVTLRVPMDPLHGTTAETIDVEFAILPAEDPDGVFVTVVGGPGGSGIDDSAWLVDAIPEAIRQRFDLVFFDQRGVGIFEDPACPETDQTFEEEPDSTDWDQRVADYEDYFAACTTEMGNPEILAFLGTDNAIHDLEIFREAMGYERLTLWGQSYGTSFAQAYATAFPDSVERLVLDGAVDRTRDWIERRDDDVEGLGRTLALVFEACDRDPTCSADMGRSSTAEAYRELLRRLDEEPAVVKYPLDEDSTEERVLTAADVTALAKGSTYSDFDRVFFLRALATAVQHDDLLPLFRLDEADPDEVFDSTMHVAVTCLDASLPGATPDEEIEQITTARTAAAVSDRSLFDFPLACVFWPHVDHGQSPEPPFDGAEAETLVVAATADPATPYANGVAVAQQAEGAHLLTVEGGSHVMFGNDNDCVDEAVIGFVLDGLAPSVSRCQARVLGEYLPIIPTDFSSVDSSIWMKAVLDELMFTSAFGSTGYIESREVTCPHGGSVSILEWEAGMTFTLSHCGLTPSMTVFGTAEWDSERSVRYLDALNVSGEDCSHHYREDLESGETQTRQRCP